MNPQPSVKEMVERISRAASDLPPEGPLQPEARNQLQDLVKQLGFALETSLDTLNRLVFSVRILEAFAKQVRDSAWLIGLASPFNTLSSALQSI